MGQPLSKQLYINLVVQSTPTLVNKVGSYSEVSVSDGATTLSVLNIERSYIVQLTLQMNIAMSLMWYGILFV